MNNLAVESLSRNDSIIPTLAKMVDYNPDTGEVVWNGVQLVPENLQYTPSNNHRRFKGKKVGTQNRAGYFYVSVFDRNVAVHRLVFYIIHGWLPKEVDHINRIRNDNRIINLRAANRKINANNIPIRPTNKSGITGVHWSERMQRWRAQFSVHSSTHKCFFEACCARKSAENERMRANT